MSELLLDFNIGIFVHFGIVLMVFLIDTLRSNMIRIFSHEDFKDLRNIQCQQALQRAQALLENGHLLAPRSFVWRRLFFCHQQRGFFPTYEARNTKNEEESNSSLIKDLGSLAEYCRNNLVSVVPALLAGTWVHFSYGELLCTRVPFFLTRQLKTILQTGVDVSALDACWVSSSSWYVMNHFSFSNAGRIFLKADVNDFSEPSPPRAVAAFLKETKELAESMRENIEIYQHKWSLSKCFED